MKLRDYQRKQKAQAYRALQTNDRVVLQSPTGSGKTVVAASIMVDAIKNRRNVVFIVERKTLVDQAVEAFGRLDLPVGVIRGDDPRIDLHAPIQVATIQTLARRRNWQQNRKHLFIIDECHIRFKHHLELMDRYTNSKWLGLSATPWAKGMGLIWQALVNPVTTKELIELGYLVPTQCWGPEAQIDLTGVRSLANDYNQKDLAQKAKVITADVVESWLKLAQGKKTLLYAVNIKHSRAMVERFVDMGVNAKHIDAYSDEQATRDAIDEFKYSDLTLLSSVSKLAVGFDAPNAEVLQIVRPSESLMLHYQMMGRGLRPSEGKQQCIIIDHTSNIERLGFAEDPTPDALDMGKGSTDKKALQRLPKPCIECGHLYRGQICPQCGHQKKIPKPKDIETKAGELKRITGKAHVTKTRKLEFMKMMKYLERQRGYKKGWSIFAYKAKYKEMPERLWVRPIKPDEEALRHLQYLDIRNAKRQIRNR